MQTKRQELYRESENQVMHLLIAMRPIREQYPWVWHERPEYIKLARICRKAEQRSRRRYWDMILHLGEDGATKGTKISIGSYTLNVIG